jgi:hypothetical protein
MTPQEGAATPLLTTPARSANRRDAAAGRTGWATAPGATRKPAARADAATRTDTATRTNTATRTDTGPAGPASASWSAPGHAAPAGSAHLLLLERERPLVVMVPAVEDADRLCLALAAHPEQAAWDGAAWRRPADAGLRAWRSGRGDTGTWGRATTAGRGGTAAGARRAGLTRRTTLTRLTGCRGRAHEIEVVVRDRVLVLLAEEMPLDEHIHARREHPVLPLEQANRAGVLVPAEDELFFLLALRLLAPHGHRDGHQDRHHRQRHEQRGHRVTSLALTP